MAISANSVFEVRTAGSDTNGGGFVTGASGTDFSQQNTKNTAGSDISTTDIVANGTTTLTSATMNGDANMVGNIIYLQGGTGSLAAGWYQIVSFTSDVGGTNTIFVVDRTVANGTGITMNIGGALLSPGMASGIMVAGNIAFILNVGGDGASVYSITSATANVAVGTIGNATSCFFQGYTSNRSLGNSDARPTLQLNVSTATMWSSATILAQNIVCDGNSQTSARFSSNGLFNMFLVKNFDLTSTGGSYYYCSATTNSAPVFVGGIAVHCEAYLNTATPFSISAFDCISSGNTGATTDGFQLISAAVDQILNGCSSISNGRHGFNLTAVAASAVINCHAESNAQWGFNLSTAAKALINCSYFGNSSGGVTTTANLSNVGAIAVTAGTVFVNAAGNNFALNNIASQGALLRAAAHPALFPRASTSNFRDIGAPQHQDGPTLFVIDD